MHDLFEQIEQSIKESHQAYYRYSPVETLQLEGAPHPDSEEGIRLVERIFQHYRTQGYPYPVFDDSRLRMDFLALQKQSIPIIDGCLHSNMVGLRIVNMFHPHMDTVTCRGYRTATQVFQDDDLFRKAIRKMLLHSKEQGRTVGNRMRIHLLSYSRVQAVSNFRPGTAKTIYDHFNPKRVLDFSMGWGGRMLAAMAGGYAYVGIDPSIYAFRGNQAIRAKVRALAPDQRSTVQLIRGCAEDVLGQQMFGQFDLIFTSPPYLDVERYDGTDRYQSYQRYPNADQWYEGFLRKCIDGCRRDLVPGGHLAINVNHDMGDRTLEYAKAAGFRHIATWRYLLSLRQQNKKHNPTHVRGEPIFVFC